MEVLSSGSGELLVSNNEWIRDFKKTQEMHDTGLEVEYRCHKCRECVECKDADKTEKVSLREECERYEVQKSVTVDMENRRIQCSLPLMGKEKDYLTYNREPSKFSCSNVRSIIKMRRLKADPRGV